MSEHRQWNWIANTHRASATDLEPEISAPEPDDSQHLAFDRLDLSEARGDLSGRLETTKPLARQGALWFFNGAEFEPATLWDELLTSRVGWFHLMPECAVSQGIPGGHPVVRCPWITFVTAHPLEECLSTDGHKLCRWPDWLGTQDSFAGFVREAARAASTWSGDAYEQRSLACAAVHVTQRGQGLGPRSWFGAQKGTQVRSHPPGGIPSRPPF